jgi:hypothetical protein
MSDDVSYHSGRVITPEWITRHMGGHIPPPVKVRRVVCHDIGEGQGFSGKVVRADIEYDQPAAAPSSVVIKLPGADPVIRDLLLHRDLFYREVIFYRDIAPTLAVLTPRVFCALIDEAAEDYVLILEDLGAIDNDPAAFLTVDALAAVLVAIAPAHAQYWNHPGMRAPWLVPISDAGDRAEDLARIADGVKLIAERQGPGVLLDCAREIEKHFPRAPTRFPVMKPYTLIHGDFHANNLARLGTDVVFYDWQMVSRGTPEVDITNMMLTSLAPEDLRSGQEVLYQAYHRALLQAGVQSYSYRKFRRNCDKAMMLNILKYVAILGSVNFDVRGGAEMRDRVLLGLSCVAEQTDALAYFRRLPLLFLSLRILNLFY